MDDLKLVSLGFVYNPLNLGTLLSILSEHHIPYLKKDLKGADHNKILFGTSAYGTEILVSEEDFERAKDLFDTIISE